MNTFHESQNAQKPLFIALPIILWLAFMVFAVIELYNFMYNGQPLGDENEELPLGVFIGIMIFMSLTFAFLLFIVLRIQLKVTISESGVYFEMPPFKKPVNFKPSEIEYAFIRKYYPIKEYGGWGYRTLRSNKAYNISGRWGIQLILKNKRRILLGIHDHEMAARVLESIGFNKKP